MGIDALDGVLINVLTSEAVDIGIDMVIDMGIIVRVPSAVNELEFAVTVSYAVGVLVSVWLDKLTAVDSGDVILVTASGIGVDMLADVDTNVFAAGIADLNFSVPSPFVDSAPSC